MKYFYRGNLNLPENHYCENGVDFYYRGTKKYAGKNYDLLAVRTHPISNGEKLGELIEKYVLPVYREVGMLAKAVGMF